MAFRASGEIGNNRTFKLTFGRFARVRNQSWLGAITDLPVFMQADGGFSMSNDFEHPPFADNLISLKGDLRQQQTAGWTPGAPVHQRTRLRDARRPDDSGRRGHLARRRRATPKKDGRYPAVVFFAAYSHELQQTGAPTGTNETGSSAVFTDRGYNHVVVSRRGMGRSQGESGVFFNSTDVDDHVAVIEWCAKQPWCDGNVVLFGTSYYAMVQPEVAVRRPPSLKAFFANGLDTDYFRQVVMFGGAPQVDFLTLWMGANFTETQEKLHLPPLLRAALSHLFNSPLKDLWEPAIKERMVAIQKAFKKHVAGAQVPANVCANGFSTARHARPTAFPRDRARS